MYTQLVKIQSITAGEKSLIFDNMQESTVNERINALVDYFKGGNKSAFAKAVGISNQSLGEILGGRRSAPSFAALQKLFTAFPEVRMEWVMFGKGSMIQEEARDKELFNIKTGQSFSDYIENQWGVSDHMTLKDKIVDIILELAYEGSFRGLFRVELDKVRLDEIEERIVKMNTISDSTSINRHSKLLALSESDRSYEEERQRMLIEKFASMKTPEAEEYRMLKQRVDEQIAFDAKMNHENSDNSY